MGEVRQEAVCGRCIEDQYLAEYISLNATLYHCSYCRRTSKRKPIAMPIDDILDRIRDGCESEYDDAANQGVGYETAEGGYQLATMTTHQLLDEVGLWIQNERLRQRIAEALPDNSWIRRDPYSLPSESVLSLSWDNFARLVKHHVRYLLWPASALTTWQDELVAPSKMLDAVGQIIVELELIRPLPLGTRLFRVRPDRPELTLAGLGPPTAEQAVSPSRMSPAGIPMFYAALDEDTAMAETLPHFKESVHEATVAVFETKNPISVVNLVDVPPPPSLFAPWEHKTQQTERRFLQQFIEDLTQPVEPDGREHIEYVPSQVVTEYIRHRLGDKAGQPIGGMVYPSARRDGGTACVLFVSGDDPVPFDLLPNAARVVPLTSRKNVDEGKG